MKKYAVFQTENGQYYYRYADTLEALEGSGFENIITEEQRIFRLFPTRTAERVTDLISGS